jgi:hypothetical protein
MKKRIGLAVLAALCVAAFGAVTASGAAAAIGPYTAYECVSEPGGAFDNAHCNPAAASDGGEYEHVAITAGNAYTLTTTQIGAPALLSTKIGLANVVLEATEGVDCIGCTFKNEGGKVVAKGGDLRYTGVTINVASCKVVGEQITTEPLEVVVQSMTGTDPEGTYVAEVKSEAGETEAVIHLEPAPGKAKCAIGTEIVVTGHANGTLTGSTAKFATGAGELLVGTQEAKLTGELTLSGGPTEGAHHPLALTTGEAAPISPYTVWTCVEKLGGAFDNAHCNPAAAWDGGEYEHAAIPAGESTQLTTTQIGEPAELSTKVGLASVVLEATEGVDCTGCNFKNEGGEVVAEGGNLHYTGVTISVASCKVVGEQITTEPLEVVVQSMTGTDPEGTYVAGVKPEGGTTEAVIHLEPSPGHTKCAIGQEIVVTGHANGKATGSTAKFETGAGELLVGTQEAKLTAELTLRGGPEGELHHPLALTTGE